MNESKKEVNKKKVVIYDGVVTLDEFKDMNSDEVVLPLGIMVMNSELDTLIKVANGYALNMDLIGLLTYYEKLTKDVETNVMYFRLDSAKLARAFNNQGFCFESFVSSDGQKRHIDKIYTDMGDLKMHLIDKTGILNLKKNVEDIMLLKLISSRIDEYLKELQVNLTQQKCKIR